MLEVLAEIILEVFGEIILDLFGLDKKINKMKFKRKVKKKRKLEKMATKKENCK